jgi:hypothetical protein
MNPMNGFVKPKTLNANKLPIPIADTVHAYLRLDPNRIIIKIAMNSRP